MQTQENIVLFYKNHNRVALLAVVEALVLI